MLCTCSGQMLKLLMEKAGDMDAWQEDLSPMKVLMAAIKGNGIYDGLSVED